MRHYSLKYLFLAKTRALAKTTDLLARTPGRGKYLDPSQLYQFLKLQLQIKHSFPDTAESCVAEILRIGALLILGMALFEKC